MPIIDGVDVSDCMYYEPKAIKMTCHEQAIAKPCGTSPICYYKLLHKAYKNCESLEQENEKLKEDLKIKDNISEKFRREALSWANIANEYQKDKTKLKHTLQEIKEIANEWMNNDWSCFHCRSNMDEKLKEILDLITKAESEGQDGL